MKSLSSIAVCQFGLLFLGTASLVLADTGFRNDGSGSFANAKPPLHWSAESNVVWKVALKSSNASPLLLGNRVFVCEEPDVLMALDFNDGHVLWAATNSFMAMLSPAEAEAVQADQGKAEALARQVKETEKRATEAE